MKNGINVLFAPGYLITAMSVLNVDFGAQVLLNSKFNNDLMTWEEYRNDNTANLNNLSKIDLKAFSDLNRCVHYNVFGGTIISDEVRSLTYDFESLTYDLKNYHTPSLEAMENYVDDTKTFEDSFEITYEDNFFIVRVEDGFSKLILNKDNKALLLKKINKKIFRYLCEDIAMKTNVNREMLKIC